MQIECPRCLLRPLVAADAETLARYANDADIAKSLRDRFPHPYSRRGADAYIAHLATRPIQTSFGIVVGNEAIGSIARVFAVPLASTSRSLRVLEKVGYVREGLMRRSAIKNGVLLDQWMYAAYDDHGVIAPPP